MHPAQTQKLRDALACFAGGYKKRIKLRKLTCQIMADETCMSLDRFSSDLWHLWLGVGVM